MGLPACLCMWLLPCLGPRLFAAEDCPWDRQCCLVPFISGVLDGPHSESGMPELCGRLVLGTLAAGTGHEACKAFQQGLCPPGLGR